LPGCVTGAGTSDRADAEAPEQLLFDCKPKAGSPRALVTIAPMPADEEPVDMDGPEEEKVANETMVLIATAADDDGKQGHCFTEAAAGGKGARYTCATFAKDLKLVWPEADPAGTAKVVISEPWLAGTKKYDGVCVKKG
jgi:hypothetical protein